MRQFWKLAKMPTMQRLWPFCKMVSLGQKLKMPKTCDKRLYKHITVVLCKKRLQKTANIRKIRPFWKLAKMPTMQRLWPFCKMVSLGQKLKMPKTCDKRLYKHITVVLCKKRLKKTANIRKMRPFCKLAKMPSMQRL